MHKTSTFFHPNGAGELGICSVNNSCSLLLFLPTIFPSSNAGPLRKMRFGKRLLLLHGPQFLPQKLFLPEILSISCSCCQGDWNCSQEQILHMPQLPSGSIHLLLCRVPRGLEHIHLLLLHWKHLCHLFFFHLGVHSAVFPSFLSSLLCSLLLFLVCVFSEVTPFKADRLSCVLQRVCCRSLAWISPSTLLMEASSAILYCQPALWNLHPTRKCIYGLVF